MEKYGMQHTANENQSTGTVVTPAKKKPQREREEDAKKQLLDLQEQIKTLQENLQKEK